MPEDECPFDVCDLAEAQAAIDTLRTYLAQTVAICLVTVAFCEGMVALASSPVVALSFTTISLTSAIIALEQTMLCSAEIIRLTQFLNWVGGAA